MDEKDIKKYVPEHSPMNEKKQTRVEHSSFDCISIIKLLKNSENFVQAFCHCHDDYEFIIPETPMPFLYYNGAVYYGEVGYVYPVYSGEEHGAKYSMKDVSHTDIVIDKEYFEKIIKGKNACVGLFVQEFLLTDELKHYIKAFKKEFDKGEKKDCLKMECLEGLIGAELAEGCICVSEDTLRGAAEYRKGIYYVADYINKNYDKDIAVLEMSRLCGLSESYFTRAFREAMGCSPKKYLLKVRISKAKLLLENTDKLISEICKMCGFKKQNSFTSLFKTMNGISPIKYRKKVKSNL